MATASANTGAPARASSNVTRRGVVAALAFTPAVAALPAIAASPSTGAWERACAAEAAAYKALSDFDYWTLDPVAKRHMELRDQIIPDGRIVPTLHEAALLDATGLHAAEQRSDELGAAHFEALRVLIDTPAPTSAAFAYKVQVIVRHQAWDYSSFDDWFLPTLQADAERFAGRA